jgi:GPH family glycoside/pentoside/hexuronide:cation symporter
MDAITPDELDRGSRADGTPARPSKPRLLLFAFGDFAFNLFWQSAMLFLLFYYTDAIELGPAVAGTIYVIASVWDGIANFLAGIIVDRRQGSLRFGLLLAAGALPLSFTFVLAYLPPALPGLVGAAVVLGGQLLFRTAYAATNVPYLAMTARVSPDTGDRAFVAGTRMLCGTAAAVLVAATTVRMGKWLTGSAGPGAFLGAAVVFAVVGAAILVLVGVTYRERAQPERPPPGNLEAALASLGRNRAFVALNAAMMLAIIAMTVLGKSVLYYFKYLLDDADAGQLALAEMGLVSGIAIPLWMLLERLIGLRALWLLATGLGIAGLLGFAAVDVRTVTAMQIFLVGMQVTAVGLYFAFWAMLPNTIEYGERETGLHVEGTVFGVAALMQRIAIGVATAILGWSYWSAGYVANIRQSRATLDAIRMTIALVPLVFLILSFAAMLMNPLGQIKRSGREVPAGRVKS